VITLKDNYYPLEIDLYYKVVPRYNLIQRWTVIHNTSQEWLEVEAALSAAWQRFKPKRPPQAI
jgi:alpha-galactosidase